MGTGSSRKGPPSYPFKSARLGRVPQDWGPTEPQWALLALGRGCPRGIKAVNPILTPNVDQAFAFGLFNRALHPELFDLRARRVVRHEGYELECWVLSGGHALRFGSGSACYSEVVCSGEGLLPESNRVTSFSCAGEHDVDEHFAKDKVAYITTIQTEQLGENLYLATFEEMHDYAREAEAMVHRWDDMSGPNMSIVDIQRFNKEVHAQAYHLLASTGIVLRTQTIFEQR